ncbi:MAG: hypothetical protein J0I77_17755 [Rudaea sp.]|uniref:hypothetical protein n=1 Tax=unclassified Rudaea TaxID=2627037 RepID=UPI0010F6B3D7|nr:MULTISPECIES: hypothetical protein [unclassified Rudaea]MBN8887574.1 hypothetical protein [Rudaea sp.]MBQ3301506.1 hypothetical protein [Eggerthellaceae bacterium]
MGEPVSSTLGIKLGTAVFGFAGGIVSLAFVKDLSRTQAILAVFVGLITAIAITPMIAEWTGLKSAGVENGVAFVIGLCAMSALPAAKNAVRNRIGNLGGTASQPNQGDGGAQ